jgi:transglutaminase-like putative cysteine protease
MTTSAATFGGTAAGPTRGVSSDERVRTTSGDLLFSVPLARGLAFAALVSWGALHWMSMLEPAEPGRGWAVVGVALLAMFGLLLVGRIESRGRRALALVALLIPLIALMLLAGGARDELLLPSNWSELTSGISRGISDLPGVRVPYRGIDPWVRFVIPLGGSALALLAALLAFWPRRGRLGWPYAALIVLIVLYVTPVVALDFPTEFLRGAVFTLLMICFLRLEKLRMPDAGAAGLLTLGAVFLALVAAPLLNRDAPWWDYETWALETSASKSTAYTWDHTYGPLDWPRDGRELLRVKAQRPAYWKTENLDAFDGRHWLRTDQNAQADELSTNPRTVQRSTQTIRVSIRNLRSEQFVTSGYTTLVDLPNVDSVPTQDGLFVPERPLRRGDTYTATVYNPRPNESQRERAGTDYPPDLEHFRTLTVPVERLAFPGVARLRVTFPVLGSKEPLRAGPPTGADDRDADQIVAQSDLAPVWTIAKRLMRGADNPEQYVQRVLDFLGTGYSYSETPPKSAETLQGFLTQAKQGYCQQFSGAMALLLRMGGVPARVATGFSTGATDSKTGEYIVRDFDAHSWVEVFYPGWGWYTYDPTPADSPARAQPADARNVPSSGSGSIPSFGGGDTPSTRADGTTASSDGFAWWQVGLGILGAAALGALALAGWRRWRAGAPPALSELERALHRTRRDPAPDTTLHALELRFAATPAAVGYVRALREQRFGSRDAHPTRAQRRGLRTELARGGGILGRLRAWWALPPR